MIKSIYFSIYYGIYYRTFLCFNLSGAVLLGGGEQKERVLILIEKSNEENPMVASQDRQVFASG